MTDPSFDQPQWVQAGLSLLPARPTPMMRWRRAFRFGLVMFAPGCGLATQALVFNVLAGLSDWEVLGILAVALFGTFLWIFLIAWLHAPSNAVVRGVLTVLYAVLLLIPMLYWLGAAFIFNAFFFSVTTWT